MGTAWPSPVSRMQLRQCSAFSCGLVWQGKSGPFAVCRFQHRGMAWLQFPGTNKMTTTQTTTEHGDRAMNFAARVLRTWIPAVNSQMYQNYRRQMTLCWGERASQISAERKLFQPLLEGIWHAACTTRWQPRGQTDSAPWLAMAAPPCCMGQHPLTS